MTKKRDPLPLGDPIANLEQILENVKNKVGTNVSVRVEHLTNLPAGYPQEIGHCHVSGPVIDKHYGTEAARILIPPAFPVRLEINRETRKVQVGLCFWAIGKWSEITIPNEVLSDTGKLKRELASYGFPIDDDNAGYILRHLKNFILLNEDRIPTYRVENDQGWIGDEFNEIMVGERHLKSDSVTDIALYQHPDENMMSLIRAISPRGTFEDWREAVSQLAPYWMALLALYLGFYAVMARYFGIATIMVEYAFKSSVGKTTCAQIALSVWGNPEDGQEKSPSGKERMMIDWSASRTSMEALASIFANLPFVIDETMLLDNSKDMGRQIYKLVSGTYSKRAFSNGQVRPSSSWQNVIISTGEKSFKHYVNTIASGLLVRIVTLFGLPFEKEKDPAIGKMVFNLKQSLVANHGHAGPKFVQCLLDHPERRDELLAEHERLTSDYMDRAGANSLAGRLASFMAGLAITARLVHEIFGFEWDYEWVMEKLWETILKNTDTAIALRDCLEPIWDYVEANPDKIYDGKTECRGKPTGACMPQNQPPYLAIDKNVAESLWSKAGVSPEAAMAELKRNECLFIEKNKKTGVIRHDPKATVGKNSKRRMLKIHWKALVDTDLVD